MTTNYTAKDRVRFFAKTQRSANGCLIWTGSTSEGRGLQYGQFSHDNMVTRAHRVAYEMAGNVISEGQGVRHVRCRNTVCVEAAQLAAGMQADNIADTYAAMTFLKPDAWVGGRRAAGSGPGEAQSAAGGASRKRLVGMAAASWDAYSSLDKRFISSSSA